MATLLPPLQGLSSRGIVNLDNAEGVLQRIIDQVNAQAATIMNLTNMVQTLTSREEGALNKVEESIGRLEQRVTAIENAIHVPGLGRSVAIGEVVGSHSFALARVTESLARKADLSEVTAQFVAVQQKAQEDLCKVYAWGASKECFQWLEEAHHAGIQKLLAVEQAMACKADKVDLSQMETALSRLRAFNVWCDDTGRRLQRVESGLERTGKAIQEESLAIRMVESRVTQLGADMANRATRDELGQVVGELSSLARVVSTKADGEELRQAQGSLTAHQSEITALQGGLHAFREENVSVLEELNKELRNTASLEQLHRKLDARTFDRHWKSLLASLAKKAEGVEVQAMEGRLRSAEEVLAATSKEAKVAVKFVKWFTDRGAAYEHNLQTLDRTVGRLAVNSLPSRREPYDGRVRYIPSDVTSNPHPGFSTAFPNVPPSTATATDSATPPDVADTAAGGGGGGGGMVVSSQAAQGEGGARRPESGEAGGSSSSDNSLINIYVG